MSLQNSNEQVIKTGPISTPPLLMHFNLSWNTGDSWNTGEFFFLFTGNAFECIMRVILHVNTGNAFLFTNVICDTLRAGWRMDTYYRVG